MLYQVRNQRLTILLLFDKFFGIPSNRWSTTGFNLKDILSTRTGFLPARLKAGFSCNRMRGASHCSGSDCSSRVSASVSSNFLLTFTRQSASIESYDMIALVMVCPNTYRLFCASRNANHCTACASVPIVICMELFSARSVRIKTYSYTMT